ncbi:ferritin-like domain-containing protein [Tellurirhabdus bombi]|uniref:ferritin-like domain-containing protein n=1 Tax=Tellurirhabdus bombi TaxID=2907205 RepID=UPI001F194905|nr:PA2169 family four-helix-bundle protein [Tellurirhabdus bombi]
MQNEDIVDILNGLVLINNDRINGYEKAAADIEDPHLATIFLNLTSQSRTFRSELADFVVRMGGFVPDLTQTSTSSKLHRTWIDIKSTFTGKDRTAILGSCIFGENAAVEEYEEVLEKENLPAYLRDTISQQLTSLRQTRDQVVTMQHNS